MSIRLSVAALTARRMCGSASEHTMTPNPEYRRVSPSPTVSVGWPAIPGIHVASARDLDPRLDDVSHLDDACRLARLHQVDREAPDPRVVQHERADPIRVDREPAGLPSRGRAEGHRAHRNVPSVSSWSGASDGMEQRGPAHGGLEDLQTPLDQAAAEAAIELRRLRRITAHVLDLHPLDHAIGARLHRERRQRADHRHRDPLPLDLLADRCPATIAGPSGANEEDAVRALGDERGRDLGPVAPAVEEPLVVPGGRAVEVHEPAERALALELAHASSGSTRFGLSEAIWL
jgi:hypothetical protein